jgi:tetratricopeptide (TPR) repeat protein
MDEAQRLEAKAAKLRNQGKGYEAVKVFQKAREKYLSEGDALKAAGCLHMMGISYKIENDLQKAMPLYDQAADEYRQIGDRLGPGRVYRDAGIMLEYHDRLDEAADYLQKSKAELENVPDDAEGVSYVGEGPPTKNAELGITLAKIGLILTRQKQFEEAEKQIIAGLKLIRKTGHVFYEMTALLHYSALHITMGNYGWALDKLEAALGLIYEHHMQDEQTRRLAQIWGLMAHSYLRHNNRTTARYYAEKSFNIIYGLSESAQIPLLKDIDADVLKRKLS